MLTASVVIYNTPMHQIESLLNSISECRCIDRLYIIDNSPTESNKIFFNSCIINETIEYIMYENIGYGSSHNIAIRKSIELGADYHIVLNPDIYFGVEVLPELLNYMKQNSDTAYVMPKVIYPNGDLQYLCKLLPNPFDLIKRRFFSRTQLASKSNFKYELRMTGYDKIMNPPCLSGCFMFLRLSTLKEHNLLFDESFFLYCEDFDLIRRIHRFAKTIYFPKVSIVHNHEKASYKRSKMLMIHIKSAIHYFNKWGWFFDKERREMNNQILREIAE